MSESIERITNPQSYYKPYFYNHPYYKYTRILPNTGNQQHIISPASTNDAMFEFPAKVFNPSKCILEKVSKTAIANTNADSIWTRQDVVADISQMELSTRSGFRLAELNFIQNHSKVIRKKNTKLTDFITNDDLEGISVYPDATDAHSKEVTVAGTTPSFISDLGAYPDKKWEISDIGTGTATVPGNTDSRRVQYTFGDIFKDTPLAVDKDLYFCGEAVLLRLLFGPGNKVGFKNNNDALLGTLSSLTTDTTLSDICIYMAVETNPDLANSTMNIAMSSGLRCYVPYTHSHKINIPSGTVHNVSLRMNRSHGRLLRSITISPFNTNESGYLAYDNTNTDTAPKIDSYYTSLDSQRIQEFNVVCGAANVSPKRYDDWLIHKDMLKGSMIQNTYQYYNNWFHCEDFSYISHSVKDAINSDEASLILGEDLSVEKRWDFTANMAGGAAKSFNYYVWAVTQRLLVLEPNNIHYE